MAHTPTPVATEYNRQSIYLTMLDEQLERRRLDHGRAFLSPGEDAWLQAHGMRHIHRYADIGQFVETDRAPAGPRARMNN